jgi:hypothetical protein
MKEEHFKWYSPNLNRDIDMLVFGHTGYPVILFPTSMGSYHENKDMGLIESAKWFIEQGLIQIFCPASIDKDSFYNKNIHPVHRIENHTWYDKMICHEIVEKVKNNTHSGKVAVAGYCWGGSQCFKMATTNDKIKAAFVFYGTGPEDLSAIKQVKAPVYGFYGGNDARVNATIPKSDSLMKAAGKTYQPLVYDGAGHGFMRAGQDPAGTPENMKARNEAFRRLSELLRTI